MACSTGVYTGNTVADETIFGEMVQLDEGTYGPAVQAVLDAQEAAFSLPSSRQCRVPDRLAERRQPGPGRGAGPAEALAQAQTEAQDALDAAAG